LIKHCAVYDAEKSERWEVRTNEQHKPVDVDLGNLCDTHGAAHDDGPDSDSYSRNCHQVRSIGLQKLFFSAIGLRTLNLFLGRHYTASVQV